MSESVTLEGDPIPDNAGALNSALYCAGTCEETWGGGGATAVVFVRLCLAQLFDIMVDVSHLTLESSRGRQGCSRRLLEVSWLLTQRKGQYLNRSMAFEDIRSRNLAQRFRVLVLQTTIVLVNYRTTR